MNAIQAIPLWGFCWVMLTMSPAADAASRFCPQPGSKVTVQGANTVHGWRIAGDEIGGWIELGPGTMSGTARIPVRSLSVNDGLTASMRQSLREFECPMIVFAFTNAALRPTGTGSDTARQCDARGLLVVAGVTNEVALVIEVVPIGNEGDPRLRLTGKTALKMSTFSIQPPEILVSAGTERSAIRYRDDVEVSFEWYLSSESGG